MEYDLILFAGVGRYGNAERVYRLEFVSNSDFTDSEFAKWKETMMLQGLTIPTMYDVEQKAKDIKVALDYKFNEEDIEMVRHLIHFISCSSSQFRLVVNFSGHLAWLVAPSHPFPEINIAIFA